MGRLLLLLVPDYLVHQVSNFDYKLAPCGGEECSLAYENYLGTWCCLEVHSVNNTHLRATVH